MSVSNRDRPLWAALGGVPLLFAAITLLQVRMDAETRSAAQEKEQLLLRSGAAIEKMSLGYD